MGTVKNRNVKQIKKIDDKFDLHVPLIPLFFISKAVRSEDPVIDGIGPSVNCPFRLIDRSVAKEKIEGGRVPVMKQGGLKSTEATDNERRDGRLGITS